MNIEENSLWDEFWERGELQSCVHSTDQDNQKEIETFWTDFYKEFGDDSVLLEIGTGNGFLPVLAVKCANELNYAWEIHGTDLADIDPEKNAPAYKEYLEQVNFQGRVAAEDLPFEDEYFDAITSQYAIEYVDLDKSLPEIARVLKKGGQFCGVFHSRNSDVVLQNGYKID